MRLLFASVVATIALGATAAQAAGVRYASPSGTSGNPCTLESPCDPKTAIEGASDNDEVVIAPGTYEVPSGIASTHALNIHGDPGQPRPVLREPATGGGLDVLALNNPDARISWLQFEQERPGFGEAFFFTGRSIDGVAGLVTNPSDTDTSAACALTTSSTMTVSNSVCIGPGTGVTAGTNGTGDLFFKNVTTVSQHVGSPGITLSAGGGDSLNARIFNSVARGTPGPAGRKDIVGAASGGSTVIVTTANDNYEFQSDDSGAGGGTVQFVESGAPRQVAPPVFTGSGRTEFHQAASSPTIDHGDADLVAGIADIDGDRRIIGPAPDIGADEFVPPGVDPSPTSTNNPQTDTAAACVVPRLKRKTLRQARRLLRRAHCRLGRVKKPRRPRGANARRVLRRTRLVVVKQSPRAGARRITGARVNVKLKRRPKPKSRR
jgi:hypothetical protein